MKNIRKGVFETNSSSSHSVTVDMASDVLDTLAPSEKIVIPSIDFYWYAEGVEINDTLVKASYAALMAREYSENPERLEMVIRVIEKHTGFGVILPPEDFCGSVGNHNSDEIVRRIFDSDESLRMFIFNTKSTLTIDSQG
jgi:hypothetical protein